MGTLLLAIDTATTCSSIAITRGNLEEGEVLASLSLNTRVTHSRRLLSSIERLLADIDLTWSDLGGIVVNLGPGSFTGLRIGLATAKGLAMASELPLYGLSGLEVLASRCISDLPIAACLDARKQEIYTSTYQWQNGRLVELSKPRVCAASTFVAGLSEATYVVGDGVKAYKSDFAGQDYVKHVPSPLHITSAETLGLCGGDLVVKGEVLDLDTVGPIYVRASDAELNLGIKVPTAPTQE